MKVEIKTNEVTDLLCLMKNNMGQIVLATEYEEKKYVIVLANKGGTQCGVGSTWETELKPSEYYSLLSGYQLTITN